MMRHLALKHIIVLLIIFNFSTVIQSNQLKAYIPLDNENGDVIFYDMPSLENFYNNLQKYPPSWIMSRRNADEIIIDNVNDILLPPETKRFARIGGSIVMGR
uniref:Secreted protein n=1 Tax=Strongyloides papillosus TaxID=174720 RepID=A0A0N5CDK4_STREA